MRQYLRKILTCTLTHLTPTLVPLRVCKPLHITTRRPQPKYKEYNEGGDRTVVSEWDEKVWDMNGAR